MEKIKKITIFLNLIILIFAMSACSNGERTENQILAEKTIQELDYLDLQIISMLNRLNNINFENYTVTSKQVTIDGNTGNGTKNKEETATDSSSADKTGEHGNSINTTKMEPDNVLVTDSNNIDWTILKSEIEILNSSWSIIILDLYNLNSNNEEILAFSRVLDSCIISIKDENKKDSLINLASLYSFIPKYLANMSVENSEKVIKQTKSYIINSYALVEQNNWTEITKNIQEADTLFKTIMTDVEYSKTKEYRINKTYVLLKELQQSMGIEDHKLFYIKYKNVMESMESLRS